MHATPNEPDHGVIGSDTPLSDIQRLHLDLINRTNFNRCEGRQIVQILMENRQLWNAALMHGTDLIQLRDMAQNISHYDTLYILAEQGWQSRLEELVNEKFGADDVFWIGGDDAADMLGAAGEGWEEEPQAILTVWWD